MRFAGGVVTAVNNLAAATPVTVDLLIVGGGGAAGYSNTGPWSEGSGGAGGYLSFTSVALAGTAPYVVTVGAGGISGTTYTQTNGSNSSFVGTDINQVAYGGGYGGYDGNKGGSGGGAGWSGTGGQGIAGQGYAGANGQGYYGPGSAGGGAGGAASNSTAGVGVANSITGSSVTYARGGLMNPGNLAASSDNVYFSGNGGNGNGVNTFPYARNGDTGVVIIKYANTYPRAYSTTGYPVYVNSGGYHIYTFQSSGTITF